MSHTTKSEDNARQPFLTTSQHEDWEEEAVVKPKSFLRHLNYAAIATHLLIALTYLAVITKTASTKTSATISGSIASDAADIYCEYFSIKSLDTTANFTSARRRGHRV
jgi:hypothetical protein